jgi:hypothetical protein
VSTDSAVTGVEEKEQAKRTIAEKARIFKYLAGITAVVVVVDKERGNKKSGRGRTRSQKVR